MVSYGLYLISTYKSKRPAEKLHEAIEITCERSQDISGPCNPVINRPIQGLIFSSVCRDMPDEILARPFCGRDKWKAALCLNIE